MFTRDFIHIITVSQSVGQSVNQSINQSNELAINHCIKIWSVYARCVEFLPPMSITLHHCYHVFIQDRIVVDKAEL